MLTPIILVAALALINIAQSSEQVIGNCSLLGFLIASLSLCILVNIVVRFFAQRRERFARYRIPARLDFCAQCCALALYAYWILSATWINQHSLATITVLPLLLLLLYLWWIISGCYGLQNTKKRRAFVLMRLRFEIVPAFILILFIDLINWVLLNNAQQWNGFEVSIYHLAFVIPILCIMPSILLKCWSCQRITDPSLLPLLEQVCMKCQVRVRGFYMLPRRNVPFYNAMAVGFGRRLQVIIISEDLIDALSDEELQAVVGHELGHLRYRHILIYLVLLLAMSAGISWLIAATESWWLGHIPEIYQTPVNLGLHALLIILGIRYVFGLVSRACERQADVHGAQMSSFLAMQTALYRVAELIGQDLDTPNWRHYSTAERIQHLATHPQNPYHQEQVLPKPL